MSKYLDKNDKEEMLKYQQLISAQMTIVDALKQRLQTWFISKFPKYSLDPNKHWGLDIESGAIHEKKEENKEEPKQ